MTIVVLNHSAKSINMQSFTIILNRTLQSIVIFNKSKLHFKIKFDISRLQFTEMKN